TGATNEYRNTAQISASDQPDIDSTPNNDDGDQSEDDEDFAIVTPNIGQGIADLSLIKDVNNGTPNVGETVTFTINVNNDGPDAATNVGISDVVPVGYNNITNISNGGILNGSTITWSVANLNINDSVVLTFAADVLAPTGAANEYLNTAQISASDQLDSDSTPNNDDGDQSEDDEDNAVVIPNVGQGTADLSLTKSVDSVTPKIGDAVTFTISVSNAGPDAATNVGISDVLPVGYNNITNISNGGVASGNTITWSIANINANDSATVTFTAEVLIPAGAVNEYLNTAQISASDQLDSDSTPNNDDGDQSEDDEDNAIVNPAVDPTGHFYCEDDGRILTGGSVSFAPAADVIINDDGSNGQYSVDFVPPANPTAYTMTVNVPPGTIPSVTRLAEAAPLAPGPAALGVLNLGSSDANNDGFLDDFSLAANPMWYDTFSVDSGDQLITNNNIPVTNCASNIIQLNKVAGQASATVGNLVQYEINARTSQALPLTDIDIEDNIPGGFSYVENSAIVIRAGLDGVLNTGDDVIANAIVTGTDPIIFEDIDFAASEELIIRYFLQIGTGVAEGAYENSATCNNGANIEFCNTSIATVNVTQDPILEKTTIIGKVFADRDHDGWQDNANATHISVKPQGDDGTGQQVESLSGRADQTDPIDDHQISMTIPLPADKSVPIEIATNEGTVLLVDQTGNVSEQHIGKKAQGLTAQDLRISTQISGGNMDLTITNYGIHEAGIPGVRLATVEGLLVETDEYGRYHLADINGGRWERGRNFILKADPSTLPEGSEFTTENPRVLRITQGLMSKINFGVKLPKQDPVYKQIMKEREVVHEDEVIETRELTSIVDPVHFESGKADIPDSYIQQLRRAIDSLSNKDNVRISVIGHTDTQPLGKRTAKKFTDNYGLSNARAKQVAKQLSESLNIALNSIETSGRGPDDPIATNNTWKGMSQNRRVEINVLFDEKITKRVVKRTHEKVAAGRSDVQLPRGGRIWVVEDPSKTDPRLDIQFHNAVSINENGTSLPVTFNNYSNYLAFIQRWEVDVYNDSDFDLIKPIATIKGDRNDFLAIHTLSFNQGIKLDDTLWYVLRVYDEENRMDETIPKRIAVVDSDLNGLEPLTEEQRIQIANSLIGKTSLSNQRIPIHGSRIRINGSGINSNYVLKVGDLTVPISHKGTFATEQHLPTGQHTFAINVRDDTAETVDRNLNVDVTGKHFFMVGLANLTVGENDLSGSVEALGEDDHFDEDVWIDGRLAFYLKGKVKGKYLITAQLDTTEDELRNLGDRLDDEDPSRIFRQLDPDQYYAVYGDDSTTIDDTDSQGAFYLRVDWD
ncbi:MAG: OmpA family protein, partial [Gammaproteobacteria bacterium]